MKNIIVKIDTECPYTSISVQKLDVSEEMAKYYKQVDSNNDSVKKEISFGVNDSAIKVQKDMSTL